LCAEVCSAIEPLLLANLTAEENLLEATVQYIHIVENFEEVLPEA
jgi:hypothetical protein